MALIKCCECGKEFSEHAKVCPNCGCPIEIASANSLQVKNNNVNISTSIHEGDIVEFGEYPQTDVTKSMGEILNSYIDNLPLGNTKNEWIPYQCYTNQENDTKFMYYKDIKHTDGNKYRAVYFTMYRPSCIGWSAVAENGNQHNNEYYTNTIYWFKFEPIKWQIVDITNGKALFLSKDILDSQEYDNNFNNNYEYSNIRNWLHQIFCNTAFSNVEQNLISITDIDNSEESTNPYNNETEFNNGENYYTCENTQDKIFLPSVRSVTYYNNLILEKEISHYALCMGCERGVTIIVDKENYEKTGAWWLRSPYCDEEDEDNDYSAFIVDWCDGMLGDSNVGCTNVGVAPALVIKLQK